MNRVFLALCCFFFSGCLPLINRPSPEDFSNSLSIVNPSSKEIQVSVLEIIYTIPPKDSSPRIALPEGRGRVRIFIFSEDTRRIFDLNLDASFMASSTSGYLRYKNFAYFGSKLYALREDQILKAIEEPRFLLEIHQPEEFPIIAETTTDGFPPSL